MYCLILFHWILSSLTTQLRTVLHEKAEVQAEPQDGDEVFEEAEEE